MKRKEKLRSYVFHVGRWTIIVGRWTWYLSVVVIALLSVLFAVARSWLPSLAEKKSDIEAYLSTKSPYEIKIDNLSTYWDGLHPGLELKGLSLYLGNQTEPVSKLNQVRVSLALLPLIRGRLDADSVYIHQPHLAVQRLSDGRLKLAGFTTNNEKSDQKILALPQWLSRLHNVVIESGTLIWSDRLDTAQELQITNIDVNLSNSGARHKLAVNADFPPDICGACSFAIDITGDPLVSSNYKGRTYVSAISLNIDNLPAIIKTYMPDKLNGRVDLQLWTELSEGKPKSAQGYVNVDRVVLPLPDLSVPLSISSMSANFSWHRKREDWQMDLRGLQVGLSGPSWTAGHLRIKYSPSESDLFIEQANLDDLTKFIRSVKMDNPVLDYLNSLQPGGVLRKINFHVEGSWLKPRDFLVQANLVGLDLKPLGKFPGVNNLSGRLSTRKNSGEFILDSGALTLKLPHVFREQLDTRRVSGFLSWIKKDDVWEINGRDLSIIADDVKGNGKFKLLFPNDRTQSPHLDLMADFRDINGSRIARYYPINLLRKGLLNWLDKSIKGGHLTSGSVEISGKLREFPFVVDNGKFKLRAKVENGVIDFLPSWPQINEADLDLLFRSGEMLITAHSGKMQGLDVESVVVHSPDISKYGDKIINITGNIKGSVNTGLDVMRNTDLVKQSQMWTHLLDPDLIARGSGIVSLDFTFPAPSPATVAIRGEYSTFNSSLVFPVSDMELEDISGSLGFTRAGLTAGRFNARLLGGDASFVIDGHESAGHNYETQLNAKGYITGNGLADAFGKWLSGRAKGYAPWQAKIVWAGIKPRVLVTADLEKMELEFPTPMQKPAGDSLVLQIKNQKDDSDHHILDMQLGELARGKLVFEWRSDYWKFWGGRIALAEAKNTLPRQKGVHLFARTHTLDMDAWMNVFDTDETDTDDIPAFLVRMSGDFDTVDLLDRRLGRMTIDLNRVGNHWIGPLKGDSIDGIMDFAIESPVNTLKFGLQRLNLPLKAATNLENNSDPREFPNIIINSESFTIDDMQAGKLEFKAEHHTLGWNITKFQLKRPEMLLIGTLKLQRVAGKDTAEVVWHVNSTDMGQTLAAFGSPEQISGGTMVVDVNLAWKSVNRFGLKNMKGEVGISAKKGRILNVDQGAGRLFGVFDFSAIARYLTLDFSSIFGKGYAFDSLKSKISLENGNAYTHDMQMKGPSADIHISGRIGLEKEDYDLIMGVNPSLAETLAITTWGLGAPQVGALILLFKSSFDKQIAKGARITYTVKGPWADPKVKRIGKQLDARQELQEPAE